MCTSPCRCFLYIFLLLRTEIWFTFVPNSQAALIVLFVLIVQSLQFNFRFCFQATRDRGSNAVYASSMSMWIAKRKQGAVSPNLDSFVDRNLRQRLKLAFRNLYRTKKVSIYHSTTTKEQSYDQTCDHCFEITGPLLTVLQKCTHLYYFLSVNVS